MKNPLGPQNRLQGAPGIGPARQVTHQAARVVQVPQGPPRPIPRHRPLLTISQTGRGADATFSVALVSAVASLRHGAAFLLVVPTLRGGPWYLDTKPKPGQGCRLPANPAAGYKVRVPRISDTHFLKPRATVCQDEAGRITASRLSNERGHKLTFELGPEIDGHPGYFALLPA